MENLHQVVQQWEKMQDFKSPGSAQCFLSIYNASHNTFNLQHYLISCRMLRRFRDKATQQ